MRPLIAEKPTLIVLDNLETIGIATALHVLGTLAQEQSDLVGAREFYGQSLEMSRKLGYQNSIASTLYQLGTLAEKDGDKLEAVRLYREALNILEKLRSPDAEIPRESLERLVRTEVEFDTKEVD